MLQTLSQGECACFGCFCTLANKMEEARRAIRKMETLCNNSINFQTRIFLLRMMGDQDLMVLMPHGNWSWRPFSQLANQLTTCRQKTTGTYFAGDSDSDASNLGRLSQGRVSRAPWTPLASASWQSCWFGQLAVRCPLPSLFDNPPTVDRQRNGHTRLSWRETLP